MEPIDLAIFGATTFEVSLLAEAFPRSDILQIAGNPAGIHTFGSMRLLVGTTGIGKVNAAAVTASTLTQFHTAEVWNIGCAGAYVESGLHIGDVVVTRVALCGDEGILESSTVYPTSRIGIPLLLNDGSPVYDFFSLDSFLDNAGIASSLPPGRYASSSENGLIQPVLVQGPSADSFAVAYGPSLTVGMVSGDIQTASDRFKRHAALAENMEGSAIAQTCFLFGIPFFEVRGISNMAGVRDKREWNLKLATERSIAAVMRVLHGRRQVRRG